MAGERHTDAESLQLATRELVWEAALEALVAGKIDQLEQPTDVGRVHLACPLPQHFGDQAGDSKRRVERSVGVLGHVRDHSSAAPPQVSLAAPEDRLSVDTDAAPDESEPRTDPAQHG